MKGKERYSIRVAVPTMGQWAMWRWRKHLAYRYQYPCHTLPPIRSASMVFRSAVSKSGVKTTPQGQQPRNATPAPPQSPVSLPQAIPIANAPTNEAQAWTRPLDIPAQLPSPAALLSFHYWLRCLDLLAGCFVAAATTAIQALRRRLPASKPLYQPRPAIAASVRNAIHYFTSPPRKLLRL